MKASPDTTKGYGIVAQTLHWLIVLLVTAQFILGETMPHVRPNTPQVGLVAWHVSVGTAILFFMLLRVLWRVSHPVPMLPALPAWQQFLARVMHWALYAVIFVMIALGLAAASFEGWTARLFGVVALPPLAAKGTQWAHDAGDVHDFLAYVLLGLIALHVAAALYHYFVRRDQVLQRMLPGYSEDGAR